MRRTLLSVCLLSVSWGCGDSPDPVECTNECECWAALNRCIRQVADELRFDEPGRSAEFEGFARTVSVPDDPTDEELAQCRLERGGQLLSIRAFDTDERLSSCEYATLWVPRRPNAL